MTREAQPPAEPLLEKCARKSRRLAKYMRRHVCNLLGRRHPTRVVFIMGAQRSGTRVPLVALESAPDIVTFREGARPFFRGGRLRPDAVLSRLFDRCPFPVLVVKPLCESHRALDLLSRFPTSRVIWIYRSPEDTIRSASIKWDSGAAAVTGLIEGTLTDDDWRRGGLTADALAVAMRLYRPGLGLHHANAIMWYLRNRLVLDLDLFSHPRVLVVKYEDLSSAPSSHFPRVFSFVGASLAPSYLAGIHDRSVRRSTLADVPPEVLDTCRALYANIDRRYQASVRAGSVG
jgi:hypothetical protein